MAFPRRRDKLPAKQRKHRQEIIEVSVAPPVDMMTSEMLRGDIETRTEASLKALKHCLEAAGTSL